MPFGFLAPLIGPAIGLVGRALGGAGKAKASNRGNELDARLQLEQLRQRGEESALDRTLAGQQEGRAAAGDAFRRILNTDYLSNYRPSGLNITPYSRPIQGPSDELRAFAADPELQAALRERATFAYDPFQGQDVGAVRTSPEIRGSVDRLVKPGKFEKFAGFLSPFLTGAGELFGGGGGGESLGGGGASEGRSRRLPSSRAPGDATSRHPVIRSRPVSRR